MAIDILTERGFRVSSEPVVRGVQFIIRWSAPDKLGMTRIASRAFGKTAAGSQGSGPRDRGEL